jgi:hypothetical protein
MIHFRCDCGTTLSAEEEARGRSVRCAGCGAELTVPASNSIGADLSNPVPSGAVHDFDAEIVSAARKAPPRPRRTPRRVETPESEEEALKAEEPSPAARYDLIRLSRVARLLHAGSWAGLILFGAGAGAVLALLSGPIGTRAVLAAVLLVLAVAGFALFRVLSELCRSVVGLAERQRETMASLAKRLRKRSPRSPGE